MVDFLSTRNKGNEKRRKKRLKGKGTKGKNINCVYLMDNVTWIGYCNGSVARGQTSFQI